MESDSYGRPVSDTLIRPSKQANTARDFSGYPGDLNFYIDFNMNSIGYYKVYEGS